MKALTMTSQQADRRSQRPVRELRKARTADELDSVAELIAIEFYKSGYLSFVDKAAISSIRRTLDQYQYRVWAVWSDDVPISTLSFTDSHTLPIDSLFPEEMENLN